ncbi:diacylglycerol kinase [Synergistaceae bacterium OttesenSCG-928-D05]|nr:diacylglycerol kinase [Synergistaceae bacterium OttesenSCG-928-D05]
MVYYNYKWKGGVDLPEWKNGGLLNKTRYSLNGLKAAFLSEKAVRNECAALFCLVLLALVMRRPLTSVLTVFLVSLLPLMVEMINTAMETIIDLEFGPTYREEIRRAKDMLSAAVFLSLIIAYGTALKIIFF